VGPAVQVVVAVALKVSAALERPTKVIKGDTLIVAQVTVVAVGVLVPRVESLRPPAALEFLRL